MALSADSRRRWLGIIWLFAAALMLLLGLTVFQNHMRAQVFVMYWMACMLLTTLTMIIALLDLRAVRRRSREEKKQLAKTVLGDFIEDESPSDIE